MLKQDFQDPSNRLSSWIGEEDSDCCNWTGVVCDKTGHVRELRLTKPDSQQDFHVSWGDFYINSTWLGGKLNPSLVDLKHLNYLDLSSNNFQGLQIPSFFGSMRSLRYLNISESAFQGIIPPQLGNLSNLQYLGLRGYKLKVENIHWVSGFSHLRNLDMSHVDLSNASDWLQVPNMLPSLKELHMAGCQLDHIPPLPTINFTSLTILDLSENPFNSLLPRWVFNLGNLVSLNLRACGFQGSISSLPKNMTSPKEVSLSLDNLCDLIDLDLSSNNFNGDVSDIFESLFVCYPHRLESLSLGYNNLSGHLTEQVGRFKSLTHLDLSANSISGPIPVSFGNLSCLTELLIYGNQFNGSLPESIGQLKMLNLLDISDNSLEGVVSEAHFTNLRNLEHFVAKGNSLTLNTSRNWLPPFQLRRLWLDYWYLGPEIPLWLRTQSQLVVLSLPNTRISDTFPTWFWNITSQLIALNLSHNQLQGDIQNVVLGPGVDIDLSYNQFNGSLPLVSSTVGTLDLSNSSFSGSLFNFFCDRMDEPKSLNSLYLGDNLLNGSIPDCLKNWKNLLTLNLKNNNLTGNIPSSIGYLEKLVTLQLHNNHFSGELPLSMQNCKNLVVVDLGRNEFDGRLPRWIGERLSVLKVLNIRSNKLDGDIPYELCYLKDLQIMDLGHNNLNNHFSGELPLSMQNCKNLVVVDLGRNEFDGRLPRWIGERLSVLKVLNIRSNKLDGDIPYELCYLKDLQIMDLGHNNLSGGIPRCFHNLSAMAARPNPFKIMNIVDYLMAYYDVILVTKGREAKYYSKILRLVTSMDLSNNSISGEIPQEITSLLGLQSLNLSNNLLTGRIPSQIGVMKWLESLDFSTNQLNGEIPLSISSLTFLSSLNLSYNNLTGQIPKSTQLQSPDLSSFVGNELCGPPLNKNCSIANGAIPPKVQQHRGYNLIEDGWFYLSLGLGFMIGFWSVLGSLLVNMPWSIVLARFLNNIVQKIRRTC